MKHLLIIAALLLTATGCNLTKQATDYLNKNATIETKFGETTITVNHILPDKAIDKIKELCPDAKVIIDLGGNKLIIKSRCKTKEEIIAAVSGVVKDYLAGKK